MSAAKKIVLTLDQTIEAFVIPRAIDWFLECQWSEQDLDREYFEQLSYDEIKSALNSFYSGGFEQFVTDCLRGE